MLAVTSLHCRAKSSGLLSLTRPNQEFFLRQRALLRRIRLTQYEQYAERCTSLPGHFIQCRPSMFFMRVSGNLMRELGVFDGDLITVDRDLPARHGCVVIAVVGGEFSVKELSETVDGWVLRSLQSDHADVHIRSKQDCAVWGVVDWSVHIPKGKQ